MTIGELLIGGQFVGGECDQTVSRSIIKSPYDEHVVGSAAEGGWIELEAAIESADQAFQSWKTSTRAERILLLGKIAREVRHRREELADLLVDEIGKPITWARAEVDRLAITFEDAAHLCGVYGLEAIPVDVDPRGKGHRATSERFPLGVILCMAPYNWPFNLVAHKIAPALASGNTVVVKTSPLAPLSTMRLVRLIHEVGAPPGVVNVWNGSDKHVIPAAKHPRVNMLSFTGSAKVGWMLKAEITDKPVILELGGNATVIVEKDADFEWATERIVAGAFGYAGQVCISIQHVLIHESCFDQFLELLREKTTACPAGDPRKEETICGPLINSSAVAKVQKMVSDAVSAGASVLVGGDPVGNVLPPTLVSDVSEATALAKEEVFGPVMTVAKYSRIEDAIATVNRSQYGIQTGLFTFDVRTIDLAYREIDTGGLIVNDYPTLRFDNLPYGGVKRSGFGREGVRYAMDEMTTPKVLLVRAF